MEIAGYKVRAFCVTLQELPEKWAFINSHFQKMGLEVEPFNGIHGTTSGLRTVFNYERDAPGSGWNIGVKPVATWISFYMLWAAMNLCPDQHFWQLEWDCKFTPDWRTRTEAALKDVPPDFDMLFIGSCCTSDHQKRHVAGQVWEVKYPQCGHSTIIAKKALPVLLRTQRRVYAPLDISVALHSLPELKVYTVLPRICEQFDTELKP